MSVQWDQEWVVTSPGGGLAVGDRIRFESSSEFHVKKGTTLFASWGVYSPVLTSDIKACTVTIGSTVYTVVYQENPSSKKDELICTSNSDSYGGTAAMGGLELLSWGLGGIVGLGVGLGIGLLLDVPWGNALAIAFAAAFAAAVGSKVVGDLIPSEGTDGGPGGPSWTAEEGGLKASEINDLLVTAQG